MSGGESKLREAIAAARATWPGVNVPPEEFQRHVEERGAAEGLHLADLYLACACLRGDREALELLERRFFADVPKHLAHMNLSAATVEDVRQQLREKLLVGTSGSAPRLGDYSGRGALAAYIRVAAVRTALHLRERERRFEPLSGDLGPSNIAGVGPELEYLREQHRETFAQAFRAALGGLEAEERNLLRWYFLDRLTVEQIGALLGVHKSTISRSLARVRQRVLETVRQALVEQLQLSPDEVRSLIRAVRSHLEVSISRHLRGE